MAQCWSFHARKHVSKTSAARSSYWARRKAARGPDGELERDELLRDELERDELLRGELAREDELTR